jgi:hypothetical protein
MSVLILLIGTPLVLKQNWKQFSETPKPKTLTGAVNNVKTFNENGEGTLTQMLADSARILFRFPPHSCDCNEPAFADAVNRARKDIGENRVLILIAAENKKEIHFFRERTKLSASIYSATDTVFALFEASQLPYACVVFPDMTARNIVSVNSNTINELISYAKEIFH